MGTARAPVVGSGDAPAWTCLVSKPQLSDMVVTPDVVGGHDPTTRNPTHQPGFPNAPEDGASGASERGEGRSERSERAGTRRWPTECAQNRWVTLLRGAGRGTPRRPLRARGPTGFGRHGRRLPRPRPPPGAGRRGQGAGFDGHAGFRGTVQARSPGRGAPEPSQHRGRLRLG